MSAEIELPAELVGAEPPIADLDDAIIAAALVKADAFDPAEPPEVERVRAWYPSTMDEADWAFRKLNALRKRQAEIDQQAAVWIDRIRLWQADESRRISPGVEFFTGRLEAYGLAQRELDGTKTTRLPSGTIETRQSGPKAVVVDEVEVIRWARKSLDDAAYEKVVKVVESVRVSDLRKVVTVVPLTGRDAEGNEVEGEYAVVSLDGEVVPGVAVEQPSTSATVKP